MKQRNKSSTYSCGKQDIDAEISDLLIAISVKAKRLAYKVRYLSEKAKGDKRHERRKRIKNAH